MQSKLLDPKLLAASIDGVERLQPTLNPATKDRTEIEFREAQERLMSLLDGLPPGRKAAIRSQLFRYMTIVVEDFQTVVGSP